MEKDKSPKTRYNEEEIKVFLHGYLYGKAEEFKEQGLFEDLTVKEIVKLMCVEATDKI